MFKKVLNLKNLKLNINSVDQTEFIENQSNLQKPPEELTQPVPKMVPEDPEKKKRKQLVIIAAIGVMFVSFSLLLILNFMNDRSSAPLPTPPRVVLPTNAPRAQTEFGKKLEVVEDQIDTSDPSIIDLDPPPINRNIRL